MQIRSNEEKIEVRWRVTNIEVQKSSVSVVDSLNFSKTIGVETWLTFEKSKSLSVFFLNHSLTT